MSRTKEYYMDQQDMQIKGTVCDCDYTKKSPVKTFIGGLVIGFIAGSLVMFYILGTIIAYQ